MEDRIVVSIARTVRRRKGITYLFWHGGEPLATGKERLTRYFNLISEYAPEGSFIHSIQTNATLIDDEWCDIFRRYPVRIGVSLDGDSISNSLRIDWGGKPSFGRAMCGINCLKRNGIDFGIISVVNASNAKRPRELYSFLSGLDPRSISFNVEEAEGENLHKDHISVDWVTNFWQELWNVYRESRKVKVRQFEEILQCIAVIQSGGNIKHNLERYMYATVDVKGDVVVLSPELVSKTGSARTKLIVGNVLENDLDDIINSSRAIDYVVQFMTGVAKCDRECEFFQFCGGGQASNKFFETGRFDTTETRHCINIKKIPTLAVISGLERSVVDVC